MFSGMSLGSSTQQISHGNDVEFEGLRSCYVPGEDIVCQYRYLGNNIAPSNDDWVGLYKIGWKSLREYLGFHWIKAASNDNADRTLTFPASTLPKAGGDDEYYLCYISQGTFVRGKSRCFKISTTVPANVTESESMLFVDLQQSNHSAMANQTSLPAVSNNNHPGQANASPIKNNNPINQSQNASLPVINSMPSSTSSSSANQTITHATFAPNNTTPSVSQVSNGSRSPSPNPTIPQQSNTINSNLQQSSYDGMRQASLATSSSSLVNGKTGVSQGNKLVSSSSSANANSNVMTMDNQSPSSTNACNDKFNDPEVRRLFAANSDTISLTKSAATDHVQDNTAVHANNNHQQLHDLLNAKLQLIWPLINYISDGCPQLLDILHQNNIQIMHSEKARHAVNVCLENLTARKREAEDFLTKVNQLSQELEQQNVALEQQKQLQNENKQLKDDIVNLTRQLDSSKDQISYLKNTESDERKMNHEHLNAIQQHIKLLEEKIDNMQLKKNDARQPSMDIPRTTNTVEQSSNVVAPSLTATANTSSSPGTSNVFSESFYAPASGGFDIYGASNSTTNNASSRRHPTSEFATGWQQNYERSPRTTTTSNNFMPPPGRPQQPTSFPGQGMVNNANFPTPPPPQTTTSSQIPGGESQLNPQDFICPVCKSAFPLVTGYEAFEHHVNMCIDSSR